MQICCGAPAFSIHIPPPPPACVSGHHLQFSHSLFRSHSLVLVSSIFFRTPKERGSHADYNRNDMKMFSVACGKEKCGVGAEKKWNRGGNVKRQQQESVAYLRAPATRKKLPREMGKWMWRWGWELEVESGKRLALKDNVCPAAEGASLLDCKNNVLFDCGQQMQFKFASTALERAERLNGWMSERREWGKRMPNRFIDSSIT